MLNHPQNEKNHLQFFVSEKKYRNKQKRKLPSFLFGLKQNEKKMNGEKFRSEGIFAKQTATLHEIFSHKKTKHKAKQSLRGKGLQKQAYKQRTES